MERKAGKGQTKRIFSSQKGMVKLPAKSGEPPLRVSFIPG
jgi:hypothetical protein